MNSFIKHFLDSNIIGYVHKPIKITSRMERFDMGESFSPSSPKIKKVLSTFLISDLGHYPEPKYTRIREIIAKKFGIDASNILPTSGAVEAIRLIPRTLCEPGDVSVVAVPTFFEILKSNSLCHVRNSLVQLFEKDYFEYDSAFVDRFLANVKQQKATSAWICTPNNPTGNVLSEKSLLRILKNIDPNCYLVIDEVYHDFHDPKNRYSAIKLIKKYPNLIVVRSLSKSYGLANVRFGFVVAHPKVIETLGHLPIFNIPGLAERIAETALRDQAHLLSSIKVIRSEAKKLLREIRKIKDLRIGGTTHSNIFLLKHNRVDLYEALLKRDILAADFRESKGLEGKGYVRITVQSPKKNNKLLMALRDIATAV